jgi:hypothetical protein
MAESTKVDSEPKRKDDELEKDELEDVSGGKDTLAGDKNCGCGSSSSPE